MGAPNRSADTKAHPRDRSLIGVLTLCLFGAWLLVMSRAPADPDLWGHVRFGQDTLRAGWLSGVDPYSFTSDRPWLNHEWLSELLMAAAFNDAGAVGLNLLRLGVVAAVLVLVWRHARIAAPGHETVLVGLAAVGITLRALPIRPQLFSLLCFAAMLVVVTRAEEEGRDRLLLWVPPLFAVWVNLHGAWIVGVGTLALLTASSLGRPRRRWWVLAATTFAALLATLANPYGWRMWTFIYSTVGVNRPMIGDWLPMYALPPAFWLGWLIPAGLCVAAWRRPERVPRVALLPVATLGLLAVRVSRVDAFFSLAAVFLLSPALLTIEPRTGIVTSPGRAFARTLQTVIVATVALVAARQLRHIRISEDLMPEPEAVEYALQSHLTGRFLTWFDWGQYVIWHLADHSVRVSIDGRRETVYSDSVVNDHLQFYSARGQGEYARRIQADYAWLPIGLPAVSSLESEGWSLVFKGPVSVILRAPGRVGGAPRVVSVTSPRDFPGP